MRPTTITLTDRETMQIGVSEHEGRTFAHVQVYFRADNGELMPTRKGVVCDAEALPDLIAGLVHLDKALRPCRKGAAK